MTPTPEQLYQIVQNLKQQVDDLEQLVRRREQDQAEMMKDIKELIVIFKDFKGAFRLFDRLNKFGATLVKWGLVAGIIWAGIKNAPALFAALWK